MPPIGIVHGYGLSGAGSNLWTRSIVRALCQLGHTVHLVCQESRPEVYDFIARAYAYDASGAPEELFSRDAPYSGRCIVHRPQLTVLPAYVRPRQASKYVFYIPDLDDAVIEEYVQRNARVLRHVAREHGVAGFSVNHVVLSSVAAQRAHAEGGAPYAVLPHGSAIEYVAKKDERMMRAASEALAGAARVFALNGEMEGRLRDVFGHVPGLEAKTSRMPVGVDTSQFDPAAPEERRQRIERLLALVRDLPRGRTAAQEEDLRGRLHSTLTGEPLAQALREDSDYTSSAPDADLERKLSGIDWEHARIVVYVGRLIGAKGAPMPVVAFPEVLARVPEARLIVAGTGGLREPLEALVWALANGEGDLAREIARMGHALEGGSMEAGPFEHVVAYFDRLEARGEWEGYLAHAREHLTPEHVVFTGFMDHGPLSQLYAVADVGVFPSVVKEASPLVVPEAAASGTFPIGTDHAGMGDSLRTLAEALPEDARRLLTVRTAPEHAVADMVEHVTEALHEPGRWTAALREAAVTRYDWQTIAARLAEALTTMDA